MSVDSTKSSSDDVEEIDRLVKYAFEHKKTQNEFNDMQAFKSKDIETLGNHNEYYNAILNSYTHEIEVMLSSKNEKKEEFYRVSMTVLLIITAIFVLCVLLAIVGGLSEENSSVIFTALGAFVTTYIVIPHAITKYLFNEKEEENMAQIIGNIQTYDSKIRDSLNK